MNMNTSFPRVLQQLKCAGAVLLLLITLRLAAANGPAAASASGPIALTSDDRFVWVVNPDNNSISVIEVGNDVNQRVTEIQVGEEPTSVAITPDNSKVYVTDRRSGTVSVIDASSQQVIGKIKEVHSWSEKIPFHGASTICSQKALRRQLLLGQHFSHQHALGPGDQDH